MRLSPIEKPRSLWMRLAYRLSVRQFGKVLTPLKVIYARKPRLALLAAQIAQTQQRGLSLEPALRLLVNVQVSRLNGCAFCEDLALADAVRRRIGKERFRDLADAEHSEAFSPKERAALRFVEEATRRRSVSDETWAAVRAQFTETEIVELVWLNAAENYFNLQAAVLGIESDRIAEGIAGPR